MNVIIDTNVFISGIFWGGIPGKILDSWINDSFNLAASPEIISEYERILTEITKSTKPELVAHWLLLIAQNAHIVEIRKRFNICRDPDDNKFIDAAISFAADYIITGDSDLLDLKSVINVKIIRPREFINLLKKKK